MSYRRRFQPPEETREYKKLFVISVEGDRTETKYFRYLGSELDTAVAKIEVVPPKSESSPEHVFEKLRKYFDDPGITNRTIELWMVIDRDQWPKETLEDIAKKCHEKGVGLCVSNPAFQFWLLLHFEKGEGVAPAEDNKKNISAHECENRLKTRRYLPQFKKDLTVDHWKMLRRKLNTAVNHAKKLDPSPDKGIPFGRVGSTVYRLVKELMEALNESSIDESAAGPPKRKKQSTPHSKPQ